MRADWMIRPLREAELAAYKDLRDEMLELHADAFTSDAEGERSKPAASYRVRLAAPGREGTFTLCAWTASERLIGAVSCERDERAKVRHIGHVAGMMVRAEARGFGVGRALLDACIARARQVPTMELLTLSVTSGNATAVALYESAGFRRYGRLVRAIKLGDAYHDKDLMSLALA
ncbi:MAG TPA: GNAT family N-acetyltransferase [Albitalea sp.]|nr:GNAT family N-acetyltransferase [Albitalea sp.]